MVCVTSRVGSLVVTSSRLLPALLVAVTAQQGAAHLPALRSDENVRQRLVGDAVHEIFPEPVPYVEHTGIIASFPKANFFMRSWGTESYRRRGLSFLRQATDEYAPPLLLANREVLDPATQQFKWFWLQDRRLTENFYQPYWGPIQIAGGSVTLRHGAEAEIAPPFPGAYRLEADCLVILDGMPAASGQILELRPRAPVRACPSKDPNAARGCCGLRPGPRRRFRRR